MCLWQRGSGTSNLSSIQHCLPVWEWDMTHYIYPTLCACGSVGLRHCIHPLCACCCVGLGQHILDLSLDPPNNVCLRQHRTAASHLPIMCLWQLCGTSHLPNVCLWQRVLQYPLCACGSMSGTSHLPIVCLWQWVWMGHHMPVAWGMSITIPIVCLWQGAWVGHHIYPLHACGRDKYYNIHCVPVDMWVGHHMYTLCTYGSMSGTSHLPTVCLWQEVWVLHYPLCACGSVGGTQHLPIMYLWRGT